MKAWLVFTSIISALRVLIFSWYSCF